jgi:hypothetical protein
MSSCALKDPGTQLQCEFSNRSAEPDFFANIGKEAAVSQPLVTSASIPSSAKEQANYCRVPANASLVHTSISQTEET